jgi:hypothetical protein
VAVSAGAQVQTAVVTPPPGPPPPGAFVSDDFSGVLNPAVWMVTDPRGDAGVSVTGTQLAISVPGGAAHDVWADGNNAPRVMQAVANTDFEIVAKFESVLSAAYQIQGILIEQDGGNFLRFDLYHDGTWVNVFAASFVNGQPWVAHAGYVGNPAPPMFLRVTRTGDRWVQAYSFDGATWTTAADFTRPLVATRAGVFAGNAGEPAPAFTALVDYAFNTASPIVPEDSGPGPDTAPPVLSAITTEAGVSQIRVRWTTSEAATGTVQYGPTPAMNRPPVSEEGAGVQHEIVLSGLAPGTSYWLRVLAADASGNVATSSVQQVWTAVPPAPSAPTINVWYGPYQRFGQHGRPQPWINVLGNVFDSDGVQSVTYSLNGQPERPLAMGPDGRRLVGAGDFTADIAYAELLPGLNSVVVTARDSLGNVAVATVSVDNINGAPPAVPFTINWGTAASIQDAAQVVDGVWEIVGDAIRPVLLGYDRLIGIGDAAWTDYEVTVPVTVHEVDPAAFQEPFYGAGVGMLLRWNGHYTWGDYQPRAGYVPLGGLGWYGWYAPTVESFVIVGNTEETIATDSSGRTLALEVPYIFKMRVETVPGQGSRYSFKAWPAADPEPSAWDLVGVTPDLYEETRHGGFLLVAHHVRASFGTVTVRSISGL